MSSSDPDARAADRALLVELLVFCLAIVVCGFIGGYVGHRLSGIEAATWQLVVGWFVGASVGAVGVIAWLLRKDAHD